MFEDQREYESARDRIDKTPELEQYRDIILFDWQEGAEHWQWITTAPTQEIVEWCEIIRKDEALDALEAEVYESE
jgi:hypothetical protein